MNAAMRTFSIGASAVTAYVAWPEACGRGTAQLGTPAPSVPRATARTA